MVANRSTVSSLPTMSFSTMGRYFSTLRYKALATGAMYTESSICLKVTKEVHMIRTLPFRRQCPLLTFLSAL